PPPIGQILRSVAEIFDSPLIQVVQLALGSTAPHECGDRLNQKTKLPLTLTKRAEGFFRQSMLGHFSGQSLVGGDQLARSAEQRLERVGDSLRRRAARPQ